jgi:signal transduction histidine kinase
MSAASSLESLLEARDLEPVDLVAIGRGCIEGYAMAYPGHRWRLHGFVAAAPCIAIGDAVAQALDKLAANAADFATPGTEVVLEIGPLAGSDGATAWRLVMDNDGPALPAGRDGDLFESLVSVRTERGDSDPGSSHLGLGLHLVQLIANFHGGTVFATDRRGGVRIGFTLPAA